MGPGIICKMKEISPVRPSPISGQWYPADPRRLAATVDGYLAAAELPDLAGQVVGIMAPHAGHPYSGPVAGYAFSALRGCTPDVVVVASPMHYPYPPPLLTTAHTAYTTPLGELPVDLETLAALDAALLADMGFGLTRVANDPEHSVEIELPFLQRVLEKPFRLVPVMVRDQSAAVARALGRALAAVLSGRQALLVASTDLSHFYPQPAAEALDAEILARVEAFDPLGVIQVEEAGRGFACGRGALAAVLWAAEGMGADRAFVLRYATSGDTTGDYDRVVGYAAAVMLRYAPPS